MIAGLDLSEGLLIAISKRVQEAFKGSVSARALNLERMPKRKSKFLLLYLPFYYVNKLIAVLTYRFARKFNRAVSPDCFLALASIIADLTGASCVAILAPIRSYQLYLGEIFGASDFSKTRYPRAAFIALLSALEDAPKREVFLTRASKLTAHEIAHALGLTECFNFNCVMHGRGDLGELDAVPLKFCEQCLSKLSEIAH